MRPESPPLVSIFRLAPAFIAPATIETLLNCTAPLSYTPWPFSSLNIVRPAPCAPPLCSARCRSKLPSTPFSILNSPCMRALSNNVAGALPAML